MDKSSPPSSEAYFEVILKALRESGRRKSGGCGTMAQAEVDNHQMMLQLPFSPKKPSIVP